MNRTAHLAALAAASMTLLAGPALATGATHTVSVGGSPLTASTTFTAATATSGTNVLLRARNNAGTIINLNCSRATASGTIQPGVDIASITSTTWVGCTFPGGPHTATQVGTWSFHSSQAWSAAANETVAGHLDNVELQFKNTANPVVCKFTIAGTGPAATGSASTTFHESTQQLLIAETGFTGNLRLKNVSGCGGQFQSGNPVDLSMALAVSAVGGAVNVTS